MNHLTLEQAADYLEAATIDYTRDAGHALTHTGTNAAGARFVMVNDWHGHTTVSESL